MITLPYLLALQVRDQINDSKSETTFNVSQNSFSEADLKYVTKITYTGDYLNSNIFTNLKSITFDSRPQVDMSVVKKILKNFPNIEELRIKNQSNIQILDLSSLKRLNRLEITSNKKLLKVIGMQTGLSTLKFYDNPSYKDESKLCKFIVYNLEHALSPNIDVLYYPDMCRAISLFDGDKQEIYDLLSSHGKWVEKLTEERKTDYDNFNNEDVKTHTITHKNSEINLIYQKALALVSTLLKSKDSEEEKLMIIYLWMLENIKYDEPKTKYEPTGTLDSLSSRRSSYQGYTKTLEFILKLAGIKVYEVPCTFVSPNIDEKKNTLNYFILKILIDGKLYYFDPRWDANRYQNQEDKSLPCFKISIDDALRKYRSSYEIGEFSGDSILYKDKTALIEYAEKRLDEISNDNSKSFTL